MSDALTLFPSRVHIGQYQYRDAAGQLQEQKVMPSPELLRAFAVLTARVGGSVALSIDDLTLISTQADVPSPDVPARQAVTNLEMTQTGGHTLAGDLHALARRQADDQILNTVVGLGAELAKLRERVNAAEKTVLSIGTPYVDWRRPGKIGANKANSGVFTTINKVTISTPATGATLTIADGKTLSASNTLALSGNDGAAVAFGAGGTVLYSGAAAASVGQLTVTTGISQGAGFKHVRQTTGAVGAGATVLVTITWPAAFVDTNYTVAASVIEATASLAALAVVHVESKTAADVTIRVSNTAAGALTGELQVIAVHD